MAKIITWGMVLAVLAIGGLAIFDDASAGTVKIGFIGALSGDAAADGEAEKRAVEMAIEEIHESGGMGGRQIELIAEDGKCDPQAGGGAAQKLVNIDRVTVIIGGTCSAETLAASEITEHARVVLISPSVGSAKLTNAGDFVFRTYPSETLLARVAAKYSLEAIGAREVALITESSERAQTLRAVYKEAIAAGGGTVVADEVYEPEDTDLEEFAAEVQKEKPGVIYLVSESAASGLAVLKELKDRKINVRIVVDERLLDRQLVKENAVLMEGLISVEAGIDFEGNPKARSFAEAYRSAFAEEPGIVAAYAYDTAYLVAEAVADKGADPLLIRDWLYGVKNWQGAVGSLSIDQQGDAVLGVYVRKVVKGTVTTVEQRVP